MNKLRMAHRRHPDFFPEQREVMMATLVFDIETAALPLESFDEAQREYLLRPAEREPGAVGREDAVEQIRRQMSLWPLTAQVVCVAMLNVESGRGRVFYLADDPDPDRGPDDGVEFEPCCEEGELLERFWGAVRKFPQVVTFNGRGFDVPFLYLRSAVLDVAISRKDWLGYRFQVEPHCDLAEQLSFYNVSGRDGAAKRFNLDFYCRSFGVESPKGQGVTGYDVPEMMRDGRYQEIAEYCLRDVRATAALYRIWKERLGGIK